MLGKLPNPKYQSIIVCDNQTVDDIAGLITYGIQQSIPQAKAINNFFIGRNTDDTCRRIWTYLKHNVRYKAEPPNLQTVKTLSRLLKTDKVGDCKHLATASAALCLSLGIPVKLRMVGFNYYDKHPKHIYTVAVKNGKEYVIDAVMNKYDTEPAYKFKRDIKLNP
jgi:transglutaminase-like putative cysteine protease